MNEDFDDGVMVGLMVAVADPDRARQVIGMLAMREQLSARGRIAAEQLALQARLKERFATKARKALTKRAIHAVANYYAMTDGELTNINRDAISTEARAMAMKVMHDFGLGPSDIGKAMKRDHSTVIYNLRNIEAKLLVDRHLRQTLKEVTLMSTPGPHVMSAIGSPPTYPPPEGGYPQESVGYPLALEGNATRPRVVDYEGFRFSVTKVETTSRARA